MDFTEKKQEFISEVRDLCQKHHLYFKNVMLITPSKFILEIHETEKIKPLKAVDLIWNNGKKQYEEEI